MLMQISSLANNNLTISMLPLHEAAANADTPLMINKISRKTQLKLNNFI